MSTCTAVSKIAVCKYKTVRVGKRVICEGSLIGKGCGFEELI